MVLLLSSMTVFAAETTYTTKRGDNLSKIAKELYGDALKWRVIYERNKDQIKDPNLIWANQTFIIPELEVIAEPSVAPVETVEEQADAATSEEPAVAEPSEAPAAVETSEEPAVAAASATWVDDLYQKIVAGNVEAVYAIICSPDFIAKCNEYPHQENSWRMEYCLLTSDNKLVGVVKELNGDGYIAAFHCPHQAEWPNGFTAGDYLYEMNYGMRSYIIGNYVYYNDGSDVFELIPGQIWEVFD